MQLVAELLVLAGAILTLIAAVGLHRFPDVFARMHAATKPATLGLLLIVVGAMLRARSSGAVVTLATVLVFQFVTAPLSMHLLARAAYRSGTELAEGTDRVGPT